jgi:ubiquinone/menaquinone biosynthesis C-methylase UbiE
MKEESVLPVPRSKEEAKWFYDHISRIYDYFTGGFERKYAKRAVELLCIEEGETILEIGFGTGHCLKQIAEMVGETGKVYGIDISSGMLEVTMKRLTKAKLKDRVELCCGDAINLPYGENAFDAVFMSFALELFDTPEIPMLLGEVKRVLSPTGKAAFVSMSKENWESLLLEYYEWTHKRWPKYFDCRPIYLEHSLRNADYKIIMKEKLNLFWLPVEIVIAMKER